MERESGEEEMHGRREMKRRLEGGAALELFASWCFKHQLLIC